MIVRFKTEKQLEKELGEDWDTVGGFTFTEDMWYLLGTVRELILEDDDLEEEEEEELWTCDDWIILSSWVTPISYLSLFEAL